MPTLPKSKPLAALLLLAVLLALPAAAQATLSYTKGFAKPHVYVAEDTGKGAHRIAAGSDPHVSPNGELVVYERETKSGPEMKLYSLATGKSKTLLGHWREGFVFAWSPDSRIVAALRGGLNGPATLVLVEVETGKQRKVATGYVNGVSFSPESDEIVYGISKSLAYPLKSDIYRYEIGAGPAVALGHDKNSAYPLWGPGGQIVFVRQLGAKNRQYGPKNELYVMNDEGQRISQLTQSKVSPLAQGLVPLGWSESGRQLLAEFGGEDETYAVAVNALTGAQKPLTEDPETGFVGAAISPDGTTVLGTTGLSFGGHPHPKVVTVPFKGGRQKVLVNGAFEPSWGG